MSMFTSHHFQRHYQNCESASTPQSVTSHKTCLRGFGWNGSIACTSAVSHVGRTSNAFKVTMKLQTFLFQMVVTSCISVHYLWKYGFAKSPNNLFAPCTLRLPWLRTSVVVLSSSRYLTQPASFPFIHFPVYHSAVFQFDKQFKDAVKYARGRVWTTNKQKQGIVSPRFEHKQILFQTKWQTCSPFPPSNTKQPQMHE